VIRKKSHSCLRCNNWISKRKHRLHDRHLGICTKHDTEISASGWCGDFQRIGGKGVAMQAGPQWAWETEPTTGFGAVLDSAIGDAPERDAAARASVDHCPKCAELAGALRECQAREESRRQHPPPEERAKAILEIWQMFADLNTPQWWGACSVISDYSRNQGLRLDYPKRKP
jgi:hypothetical protein